ncbi:conserved hypothetical protein [Tenacibaculum litopenaei]|jgi:alkanesulfonate monooxygenase SsuD/methylene tetrahydromethanopterin reductase-like flavin-dependent oxidoreductase (luciferase family)|uniref:LLM class flavin-dependent oxidoreductase n=1 Tax=Tenacibaculum litopenaei TaxID=396016 RepID=UPI00389519D9
MRKNRLGILELGERDNKNTQQTLVDIVAYASAAEAMDLKRFWLAEHHTSSTLTSYTNPEMLMTIIAGSTEKIKVGSAGSIINYYSPYTLASNYKFLNNLFHDRIDFGLSKGHNINKLKHDFLNVDKSQNHFELFQKNIASIHKLFYEERENLEEFETLLPPFSGSIPQTWYLSSSYKHLDTALKYRLNYCRSLVHGDDLYDKDYGIEHLLNFRKDFYNQHGENPTVNIAIGVSIDEGSQTIEKMQYNGMTILKLSTERLRSLVNTYFDTYQIDEIIIYDIEKNNEKKIENLAKMVA